MKLREKLDPYLLLPAVSISVISLFLLLSTGGGLFVPQLIFSLSGLGLYLLVVSIDYRVWPRFTRFFYVLTIVLLGVLFFLPHVRGSQRWIDFGWFVIQPSEILKPFIVLLYAALLFNMKNREKLNFPLVSLSFLPVLALVFFQPDLGNAIIYLVMFLGLIVIGGIHLFYLLSAGGLFLVLLPGIWNLLKEYQKQRIYSFLNPRLDPSGAGYNAIQSMIAIGSGGLTGLGLGRGTQSRLLFLPEYQTDFIFASLVESLGLVGGMVVIILYFFLLVRILITAFNARDGFGSLVAAGIFCQIFAQVIINIGMNVGLLPITGITLPLLSYGGSSVVSTYIALGLISAVSSGLPRKLLVIR